MNEKEHNFSQLCANLEITAKQNDVLNILARDVNKVISGKRLETLISTLKETPSYDVAELIISKRSGYRKLKYYSQDAQDLADHLWKWWGNEEKGE